MLKILQIIEKYFWFELVGATILAFIFPSLGTPLLTWVTPLLMIMLYFAFLKVDLHEVLAHIKNIKLTTYLTLLYMLVIPALTFLILHPINPTVAVAFLLLTAIPPGTASPALTSIAKGNVSLSLATAIICSLVAPFTMPFLFEILTSSFIKLNSLEMMKTLATMLFIPLIAGEVTRSIAKQKIEKARPILNGLSVIAMMLLIFIVLAAQSHFILDNLSGSIFNLIYLFLLFAVMQTIGYWLTPHRPKPDRIAISINTAFLNNSLAIVLAYQFFSPEIIVIAVLSEIPWSTMLGPFRWILNNTPRNKSSYIPADHN